jgi:hypothetical protein
VRSRRTRPPERYVPIDLVLGPTSNLGKSNLNTLRGSYDAYCQSCPSRRAAVKGL